MILPKATLIIGKEINASMWSTSLVIIQAFYTDLTTNCLWLPFFNMSNIFLFLWVGGHLPVSNDFAWEHSLPSNHFANIEIMESTN